RVSYFKDEAYSGGWAWLSIVISAITFRQTLTLFHSPNQYDAFAWIAFAALYMILERLLSRIPESGFGIGQQAVQPHGSKLPESRILIKHFWFNKFHLPLASGFISIATLGLYLGLPSTLAAFRGFTLTNYLPPIVAQMALVLLVIASARLYRTRLPMF